MNTQTKDKPGTALVATDRLPPPRLPITHAMQERLGIDDNYWRTFCDTTHPNAQSVEGIILALNWARSRGIDPMIKPCHVVSVWSSAKRRMVESVWMSIAYQRIIAHRTREYAGLDDIEYGPSVERTFTQKIEDERDPRNNKENVYEVTYPKWAKATVYRLVQGEKYAFSAKVFWPEIYSTAGRFTDAPNEMWRRRPFGQVAKCVEAAVLRVAFPEQLGGELTAEEMEGKVIDSDAGDYRPQPAPRKTAIADERDKTVNVQVDVLKDKAKQMAGKMPDEQEVVDVEVNVDRVADEDAEPFDFEEFSARLGEAPDEATVQEVWKHWRIDERFADNAADMTIALKAKMHRVRQLRSLPA